MVKKSSNSKSTKSNSKVEDIRFIRLTNGEDIVAEVLEVTGGKLKINNPLKIVYTPSLNSGYLSISLMQWVFTRISKDQKFDIDLINVLVMTETEEGLKTHYKESISVYKSNEDEMYEEPEDVFDNLNEEDGLEVLKNLMQKIKSDKGRLH